jgi:single-stranded DNA-binding protein
MNTLKISGTVYRAKSIVTSTGKPMHLFGLMFANKKDKDGKFKGQFVNVKCFKNINPDMLADKSKVVIDGFLGLNEYTNKEGKLISGIEIIANNISPLEETPKVDETQLPNDDFSW